MIRCDDVPVQCVLCSLSSSPVVRLPPLPVAFVPSQGEHNGSSGGVGLVLDPRGGHIGKEAGQTLVLPASISL